MQLSFLKRIYIYIYIYIGRDETQIVKIKIIKYVKLLDGWLEINIFYCVLLNLGKNIIFQISCS